jgi:drug/metabolite transporter (DMT)-like permease
MIYLLLTVLSSTSIYIIFKLAKNYSCQLPALISANYLVATVLGFLLFQQTNYNFTSALKIWGPFAFLLGLLFIIMFFLIGNSSQKAGITVTTLANKLSLVFPVLFSIIYFREEINFIKYAGIATAFVAVLLTLYKTDFKKNNQAYILLPLVIFFGSGITDSVVKYVQTVKIKSSESAVFSSFVFLFAFIISFAVFVSKGKMHFKKLNIPTLFFGFLLGLVNFGSLYFILIALNKSNLESSRVFALVNMSIVVASAVSGRFLFKEKLSKINTAGIFLALISIYLLL